MRRFEKDEPLRYGKQDEKEKLDFKKTSEHIEMVAEKPLETSAKTLDLQNSRKHSPLRSPRSPITSQKSPHRRTPETTTSNFLFDHSSFETTKRSSSVGIQVDTIINKFSKTLGTQTKPIILDDQITQTDFCEIHVNADDYSVQENDDEFQETLPGIPGKEFGKTRL